MSKLKAFGAFWYDFVIGDDWHVAALVAAGLAVTALLVHVAGVNAWWLLPLVVFAALGWSLHRATSRKPLRATAQGHAAGTTASDPAAAKCGGRPLVLLDFHDDYPHGVLLEEPGRVVVPFGGHAVLW
jgi:hypothetical protein